MPYLSYKIRIVRHNLYSVKTRTLTKSCLRQSFRIFSYRVWTGDTFFRCISRNTNDIITATHVVERALFVLATHWALFYREVSSVLKTEHCDNGLQEEAGMNDTSRYVFFARVLWPILIWRREKSATRKKRDAKKSATRIRMLFIWEGTLPYGVTWILCYRYRFIAH